MSENINFLQSRLIGVTGCFIMLANWIMLIVDLIQKVHSAEHFVGILTLFAYKGIIALFIQGGHS